MRLGGTGSLAKPALRAALCAAALLAGGAHADTFERRLEVKPDVRVEIELLSGKIELRAIDANELRVRASGELEIDGSQDGGRVSIGAPSSGWRSWRSGASVDLEVELPRNSRITARTGNGEIDAEGVAGELVLHSANGEIEVKGAPPEAYLETMNAAIKFEGEKSEVVARTLNGQIELKGVTGAVEATTMSGQIEVEGDGIERAELRTMSGQIELDASLAPGARVEAKTYSGQVKLRLAEDASARFDVQSFSGSIESDFSSKSFDVEDDDDSGNWSHGPGRRRSFVVGPGDARISIESFSGGVKIERGERSGRRPGVE